MVSRPRLAKKKRDRSVRREAARRREKIAAARRTLHLREAGGSADHPIDVQSASQIDGVARALTCAGCDEKLLIEHEHATVRGGYVVRTVELRCRQCGEPRVAFFRVMTTVLH